jgi:hypothetical protein
MVGIPVSEDAEVRIKKLLETAQGLQAANPDDPSGQPSTMPPVATEEPAGGDTGDDGGDGLMASLMAELNEGSGGSGSNGKPDPTLNLRNGNGRGIHNLSDLITPPFPNRLG